MKKVLFAVCALFAGMLQISRDVLAGKLAGEDNPQGMIGLNKKLVMHGMAINYSESALK